MMKNDISIPLNAFVTTQNMVIELCNLLKLVNSELHPLIQIFLEKRCELYLFALSETVKNLLTDIADAKNVQDKER
ncbi:hypothetical protein [Legionella pneumophila]